MNTKSMKSKTVLITGATDGIGKATAHRLAEMGARVLIHGRDAQKAEVTRDELILATGNPLVETIIADLAELSNVRRMAEEIESRVDHLDVLINNAGVYLEKYIQTPDGYEMTFAVNHLSHFLLTNLLLDLIKKSALARIVTVSSSGHKDARFDLENLNAEKKFHGWGAYCISKLGNLLFAFALARRLSGTGVTSNALHPGAVNTKMLAKLGVSGKPVEKGAETSIYLASAAEVAEVTGEYYTSKGITEASEQARDIALQEKFWEISAQMVGLDVNGL
jgi:NAD(P)-dependent dehydrogenase (short-subunit alcohol dehydrogenase family)